MRRNIDPHLPVQVTKSRRRSSAQCSNNAAAVPADRCIAPSLARRELLAAALLAPFLAPAAIEAATVSGGAKVSIAKRHSATQRSLARLSRLDDCLAKATAGGSLSQCMLNLCATGVCRWRHWQHGQAGGAAAVGEGLQGPRWHQGERLHVRCF